MGETEPTIKGLVYWEYHENIINVYSGHCLFRNYFKSIGKKSAAWFSRDVSFWDRPSVEGLYQPFLVSDLVDICGYLWIVYCWVLGLPTATLSLICLSNLQSRMPVWSICDILNDLNSICDIFLKRARFHEIRVVCIDLRGGHSWRLFAAWTKDAFCLAYVCYLQPQNCSSTPICTQ